MAQSIRCRVCGVGLKEENEGAHMRKVHPTVPFKESRRKSLGRRGSFSPTARTKKTIFAIVVVAVVAIAGILIARSAEKGTPIDEDAVPVRVSMSGFSPSALTAKAGTPLKIDLINMDNQYHTDGGGWHDFVLDAFGMNVTVEPLGQRVFTIPTSTPGTYAWYCDMCCGGRENPSMIGRLTIEP